MLGELIYMDYGSYIARNDSVVFGYFSKLHRVDISKQNPNKIFAFSYNGVVKSYDGGYNYPLDSIHNTWGLHPTLDFRF